MWAQFGGCWYGEGAGGAGNMWGGVNQGERTAQEVEPGSTGCVLWYTVMVIEHCLAYLVSLSIGFVWV